MHIYIVRWEAETLDHIRGAQGRPGGGAEARPGAGRGARGGANKQLKSPALANSIIVHPL